MFLSNIQITLSNHPTLYRTCDLGINSDHLLIEGNPCTKFGIDHVKGSKDIDRTTQWAEKSCFLCAQNRTKYYIFITPH